MATNSTKPVASKEFSNSDKVLGDIIKSINGRTKTHYIETGRDLIRASEILAHGKLGPWLKVNFGWSPSTARNFMNAAKLNDKNAKFADLQPSALMALAAPSVPVSVVGEVLADLVAGKRPTVAEIKEKIASARAPKPKKIPEAVAEPAPAAVSKSPYQDLLDLLKQLGPQVAENAIKEAFAQVEEDKPAPVIRILPDIAAVTEEPQPAPGSIAGDDDDELKDLVFPNTANRKAA